MIALITYNQNYFNFRNKNIASYLRIIKIIIHKYLNSLQSNYVKVLNGKKKINFINLFQQLLYFTYQKKKFYNYINLTEDSKKILD